MTKPVEPKWKKPSCVIQYYISYHNYLEEVTYFTYFTDYLIPKVTELDFELLYSLLSADAYNRT